VAFFPDGGGLELFPGFAVCGVPHVVPVAGRVVGPAADDPEVVSIDGAAGPDAGGPRGGFGQLGPGLAIFAAPDVIFDLILGEVVSAPHHIEFVIHHDGLMIGTGGPAGVFCFAGPGFSIFRRPDVVFQVGVIAEVILFGAAEDPHFAFEDGTGGGHARCPAGSRGDLLPLFAVGGGPDVIAGRRVGQAAVVPAAH